MEIFFGVRPLCIDAWTYCVLDYSGVITHGVEIEQQAGNFQINGGIAHEPDEKGHCDV